MSRLLYIVKLMISYHFAPCLFSFFQKTGTKGRKGPSESIPAAAPKFGRNYKAPNIKDMKKDGYEQPKKKLFGLF